VLRVLAPVIGLFGTIGYLRWRTSVRAKRLRMTVLETGTTWVALSRVLRRGDFLDDGRSRRYGGPRGMLSVRDDQLEWKPDPREQALGDLTRLWPLSQVGCDEVRLRRDITGIDFTEATLYTPDGVATISIFGETGRRPPFLSNS
jgi:hypothetical protein